MKLKRLDLHGFKSFSEITSFSFQSGITCVVGPNGCGKSNIVDAIRWCLGEQSAHHLRGDGMEDVIFNGSSRRRPLGMSEVSLIFSVDPGDSLTPPYAGFNELMVTRRLFRSGESEYFINKVPCRLKDITDIFLDTGVGTHAYSIVEQGQVDTIIQARPEERRSIIEGAAGIRKYRERKREALRRMEITHINLQRISDILVELERQINSLNRQAKKAERYKNLREEIKKIEIAVAWMKHRSLSAVFRGEEEEERALRDREKALVAETASAEGEVARMRDRVRENEAALTRIREDVFRIQNMIQERDKDLAVLGAREENLRAEKARQERETESASRQREEAAVGLEGKETALTGLDDSLAAVEADIRETEGRLAGIHERKDSLAREAEETKGAVVDILTTQAQERNAAGYAEKARQDAGKKLESLRAKAGEIDAALSALVREIGATGEQVSDLKGRRGAQEADLQGVTRQRSEVEAAAAAGAEAAGRLSLEMARAKEKLSLMREREAAAEGDSLLEILTGNGRNGILGRVGEIFETDPQFRHALEAVLGERLMNLIVKDPVEGVQAVEYLKERSAGRGTFIPVGLEVSGETAGGAGEGAVQGGPQPLLGCVRVKEEFQGIARHLLKGIYLVRDLREALDIRETMRSSNGHSLVFVTTEGDFIDQHGIVTGGSRPQVRSWWRPAANDILSLEESVRQMSNRSAALADENEARKEDLARLSARIDTIREDMRRTDILLAEADRTAAELRAREEHLRRDLESIGSEAAALGAEIERIGGDLRGAQDKVQSLEKERADREASLARAREELARIGPEGEALAAALEDLRVKASREKERSESLRREAEEIRQRMAPMDSALQALQTGHAATTEALTACAAQRTRLGDQRASLLTALREGEAAQADTEKAEKADRDSLFSLEESLGGKKKDLEEVRSRAGTIGLRLHESRLTLTHLEESIREKYQTALTAVTEEILTDLPPEEERERVLEELRGKLDNMGEVNLLALEEYKEVKERYELMTAQKTDLLQSIENLESIIKKLNSSYKEKFSEAFHKVNTKFMEVFPKLFQGGRAELKIVGDEDLQECGIEIVSQPPGKRLQSITLLSGGEKAMTAVALIFALFLIKSTPFCLMDEIDAPLDDANIGRFIGMLRELSQTSQFIIITHNKRTMESGQVLYGITMEEPGVSTIVSVKLN